MGALAGSELAVWAALALALGVAFSKVPAVVPHLLLSHTHHTASTFLARFSFFAITDDGDDGNDDDDDG